MKGNTVLIIATLGIVLILLQGAWANEVQENPVLSLSGLVRFPVHFTMNTLAGFQQTRIRVTEVRSDEKISEKNWYQTCWYDGVPLSRLLETVHVWKEDVQYKRLMDLAILVRGASGHAVLSWPEIGNADSGRALIALGAEPVPPLTKEASSSDVFPPWSWAMVSSRIDSWTAYSIWRSSALRPPDPSRRANTPICPCHDYR